jgi:nucleoside-diphosphate-sugar epimerase
MEGLNAYKDTKLEAEKMVKNSQVPEWLILRFTNVIGTDDPNDFWNNPFLTKEVLGRRIGLAKIPSKKNAPFPYLGIDTATEATLKAITAKPNQTITILDGFDTVEGYLTAMARVNNIDFKLALPHSIMIPSLVVANKIADAIGISFPMTPGVAKIIGDSPELDNETMQRELGVKPQNFEQVIYKARERLRK